MDHLEPITDDERFASYVDKTVFDSSVMQARVRDGRCALCALPAFGRALARGIDPETIRGAFTLRDEKFVSEFQSFDVTKTLALLELAMLELKEALSRR